MMGWIALAIALAAWLNAYICCRRRMEKRKVNRAPVYAARCDRCICCGEPIPEGRGVCWRCEHEED